MLRLCMHQTMAKSNTRKEEQYVNNLEEKLKCMHETKQCQVSGNVVKSDKLERWSS